MSVVEELIRDIEIVKTAGKRATYFLRACKVGDRLGLYFRDYLNRSSYRAKLQRRGMEFSDSSFIRWAGEGRFQDDTLGTFAPDFLITQAIDPDSDTLVRLGKGMVAYWLGTLRLGPIEPLEFSQLAALTRTLDEIGGADPNLVADYLMGEHSY